MQVNLIKKDGKTFAAKAQNGTVILAKLGESLKDFKARVTEAIDDQFVEDANFVDVTLSTLSKMSLDELNALDTDGITFYAPMVKTVIKSKKSVAKTLKGGAKKTARKTKTKPKSTSMAEAEKEKKRASKNIGKFCTFDVRGDVSEDGQIKSVFIDSRIPAVMYRIATPSGVVRRKTTSDKSIVIDEAKTQAYLKKIETEKAEQEAAEKALQDLKDKRRQAKEDAKNIKLEARAKREKAKAEAKKAKLAAAKEAAKAKVVSAKERLVTVKEKAKAMIADAEAKVKAAQERAKGL